MGSRGLLSGAGMRGRATLASDTALAREAQLRWPLTQGRDGRHGWGRDSWGRVQPERAESSRREGRRLLCRGEQRPYMLSHAPPAASLS